MIRFLPFVIWALSVTFAGAQLRTDPFDPWSVATPGAPPGPCQFALSFGGVQSGVNIDTTSSQIYVATAITNTLGYDTNMCQFAWVMHRIGNGPYGFTAQIWGDNGAICPTNTAVLSTSGSYGGNAVPTSNSTNIFTLGADVHLTNGVIYWEVLQFAGFSAGVNYAVAFNTSGDGSVGHLKMSADGVTWTEPQAHQANNLIYCH